MDTELLVENRIDDGRKLISELIRAGFDVSVAFWAQLNEGGTWYLYIGSNSVAPQKIGDAYSVAHACLLRLPESSISLSEIKLVPTVNPIARDAIWARERHGARIPIRYQGKQLGNLAVEDTLIYPRLFPWEVRKLPDGPWEVRISEPDDVWLACDSEEDARAIAAAPVLRYESLDKVQSGPQFAAQLQKTADAFARYRMSFGSRFFTWCAEEARK